MPASRLRRLAPLLIAGVCVVVAAGVLAGGLWLSHRHKQHYSAGSEPHTAGFPDAATTGVPTGTKLTRVPQDKTSGDGWAWNRYGWIQVQSDGATLTGLDVDGSIHSDKSGVTITDTRIRCTGENDWCLSIGSDTTVRDTEIGGQGDGHSFGKAAGVYSGGSGSGNVLQRLNIHNTSDGLRIDGGTTLEDSWVHDLIMGDPVDPGAHSDGVQSTGGANVVITHNRFETGNNCNVFVQWLSGQPNVSHYQVSDNLFLSGHRNDQQTSYGVCIYGQGVQGPVSVTGNTFSHGWQVAALTAPPETTLSANHFIDGAAASTSTK